MQDGSDFTQLSYTELHKLITENAEQAARLKALGSSLTAELNRRLGDSVKQQLDAEGKTFGTVNLPLQDGLTVKCVVGKKIEWDSDMLFEQAIRMSPDRARSIFKFAVSVPEKIYEGIKAADPELGMTIDKARTTKPEATKYTLTKEDV